MGSVSYVNLPAHNGTCRGIQSVDVIEDWNLDHHLASAVKYIEKSRHENQIVENLKKAAWYLDHASPKDNFDQEGDFILHQVSLGRVVYPPEVVCDDWQLSDLLCSALINIFLSRGYLSPLLRSKVLNAAHGHLREEIVLLKQKENMKSPLGNMLQTPSNFLLKELNK